MFNKVITCPYCHQSKALRMFWKVSCANRRCSHYNPEIANKIKHYEEEDKSYTPASSTQSQGLYSAGPDKIEIIYTNRNGERKSFTADPSSVRDRGEFISAQVEPTGTRCSFRKYNIENYVDIEMFADAEADLTPVERQIMGYHRKHGTTSPRYEEIMMNFVPESTPVLTPDRVSGAAFTGRLRPSQVEAVRVIKQDIQDGGKRLHIVAPPGSGKTILGLYVWAELIGRPALVLSPNTAIQQQWVSRLDLFGLSSGHSNVSTDPDNPALFTSLTYQSVTMPDRDDSNVDQAAVELWIAKLIEDGEVDNEEGASLWITDLQTRNPDYYDKRISAYRKKVREELSLSGNSLSMLHESSLDTLKKLKELNIGLIIFDECHHLMGHWGRVLADAHELLDGPVILGLTATPPDEKNKKPEDVTRYNDFFGPIDYEVPVPALVKERNLAPYQDLAYFVRPDANELVYIADSDEKFHAIVEELCESYPGTSRTIPMTAWVKRALHNRQLPGGGAPDWKSFERRDPSFALMARRFLVQRGEKLPHGVPSLPKGERVPSTPELEALVCVMDRYIRHALRRSSSSDDQQLAEQAISRLRMLGVQITETGSQACASPVGRVMAYSRAKTDAVVEVLKIERKALAERIRAIVIADFEKSSAIHAEIEGVLSPEAGGAIAAFRAILSDYETDKLDPILVTGSTVLVDDDLIDNFMNNAKQWLSSKGISIALSSSDEGGFHQVTGTGSDWCPRVYVEMITALFQKGITRCLVGTRGLLGEGWDANRVNVLIDLTTVTTSMTVNQLRGRSIRLDPAWPDKLSNNWDIVCVADEFTKGLDDYKRFNKKHATLYGVTDDSAIEKGVGHVHPAFTAIKPEGIHDTMEMLNDEMALRAADRATNRALWKIGEPFKGDATAAIEIKQDGGGGGFPPFNLSNEKWSNNSLTSAIGKALLFSLTEAGILNGRPELAIADRAGNYTRAFLKKCTQEESEMFAECLQEATGPLDRPRYVIERFVDNVSETWLSEMLPEIIGRYFRRRDRVLCMIHAVPTLLAKNKDLVAIYKRHWNSFVSPGEAYYAYQGQGQMMIELAKDAGHLPETITNRKDIFL